MPRQRKVSIVTLKGETYCRVQFCGKRTAVRIVGATSKDGERLRSSLVFEVAGRLEEADREGKLPLGWEETGRKILTRAGGVETVEGARKIRTVLAHLIAGNLVLPNERVKESEKTFRGLGEAWTSGALHDRHPDYVRKKVSAAEDVWRLEKYVYPILGKLPIADITKAHCDRVKLRANASKDLGPGGRRHVAQLVTRILNLAVSPCEMIPASPLPKGWLPSSKLAAKKAHAVLFPKEEQRLIECAEVPVDRRVFYALLSREGARKSELYGLTWSDFDFDTGTVALDRNKTNDPRSWVLTSDVPALLIAWRKLMRSMRFPASADARLFPTVTKDDVTRLANHLRADLRTADVKRPQLFESSEHREHMRAHDLRATFVTVNSANGKSELWITDRTGHRSSAMVRNYRRQAAQHAELNLGPLAPLNTLISEVSELAENRDAIGRALLVRTRGPKRKGTR